MKTNKILTISTLSAILLFSACSSSQDKLKKESISIYKIMGITKNNKQFTKAKEYKQEKNFQDNVTSDITYISYKKKKEYREEKKFQNDFSSDITYISYKKENNFEYENLKIINDIENKAKSFLGVPYVWGATGPSKFDCSGFTQWVYRDSGINIPRVSKDQARVGQFISYENLQRGDMVFFDTKKKRTGRVTHVGIYLGSNNFIHASSTGKSVVIYNFNEKTFYKKRFLWGRRVIKPSFHYALN